MNSRLYPAQAPGDDMPRLARASKKIKAKIEERFGFFPPFFTPALETPEVLEALWQQTLSAYVNNPLPALFKEKLFAYLSRYCAVPYCIICHSCALRPLGMTAAEVLALLTEPGPAFEMEISKHRDLLAAQPSPLDQWPAPGSALDESLMACSIFSFLNPRQAEDCRAQLRRLLGEEKCAYLMMFLGYVKTCHLWVEAHPELAYEADQRAQENLGHLLAEEPRLAEFFRDYNELIARERQDREERLGAELAALERERGALREARDELETKVIETTAELRQVSGQLKLDITERKRAEEALRESQARMAGIIGSAMDAIITVDAQQRVVLFNAAAERMFQCPVDEALGQPLDRFIPERFRHAHQNHIRTFGQAMTTRRSMGSLGAVFGLRADGQEFPIEASISQIETGGQKLFTVILRDITARKQSEERLIEQAALLDQSHDAIIVRDLDNRVRYWSRGAERLYGWTAEEAVGRPVQELTYRESLSQLAEATRVVIEKGIWNGELRHLTKDGREVIIECHWTLVRDAEGNPKTILAINTDITEKKRLHEQFLRAQRLESIGTLASGIAHDLNNILSPITMGAQMLQMKQQDEQSQRLLEVMRTNAERGAEMIKQVLSFASGIGGERLTIQPKHLIREIVRVAEETFPKSLRINRA